jgi:hypothetical protein
MRKDLKSKLREVEPTDDIARKNPGEQACSNEQQAVPGLQIVRR